jgi:hypothetical protein
MFHDPPFWDHFRRILSFAKLVHDEHQQIDTAVIDTLYAEVIEVFNNPGASARVISLLKAWNQYLQYFQNRTEPNVYTHLTDELQAVEAAFAFMVQNAGERLLRDVKGCEAFYHSLRKQLTQYQDQCRAVMDTVDSARFPRLPEADLVARLVFQAGLLSKETKTIVMNSDRLIVNLIEMIRRPGDPDAYYHDARRAG